MIQVRIQFLKSRSILEIQINSKNPNAIIKIQIQFSGGLAPHLNRVLEMQSQFLKSRSHSNNPTADLVLQSSATENNMNLLKPGLKASNRDPRSNPILEIQINSKNPNAIIKILIQFSSGPAPHLNPVLEILSQFLKSRSCSFD